MNGIPGNIFLTMEILFSQLKIYCPKHPPTSLTVVLLHIYEQFIGVVFKKSFECTMIEMGLIVF